MKWLRKNLSTIILMIVMITGLCLLLYPSFSNYWNSFHQSRAISDYAATIADIDNDEYEKLLSEAIEYNNSIDIHYLNLNLTEEELETYNSVLDITGTGIMGYIEIKKINCHLPIYHGTDEAVLQIAVGHIAGTSLPIGGESTHCVLSGHRGLPSARLFTDIDQLVEGDTFVIRVMDEVLTYAVDQILIVLPEEVESLAIEEGEDYCTLVTCTPYGVNSHRLLVRGHRVENEKLNTIRVTADAQQIDPLFVAPIVALPLLFIAIVWMLAPRRRKKMR